MSDPTTSFEAVDFDWFARRMLGGLAETLESVVGLESAEGFLASVGKSVGDQFNRMARESAGVSLLDQVQVASALVELKSRIGGSFEIVHIDASSIVLRNARCPFGDMAEGRPALCMMTSNVFGRIAADNLGYAAVELAETIAAGDGRCTVVIELEPLGDASTRTAREYFRLGGCDGA